ncbi:hypothetical protein G9464_19660 [Halostella sp. JP-L12]|uniref:hypothetical protein n=1 Tax=Halostella TaxID=1843185 RepID=UPI000EF75FDF|nr:MULTISPECIES: hypothetical protein [Halostella]NHN49790.1 hypothetical protein [Halostella sp. JP-L12]
MSSVSRTEWAQVSDDPDLEEDLGYEMIDLEIIQANNKAEQYMFLPQDEEMLTEEAFIVAEPDSVVDINSQI